MPRIVCPCHRCRATTPTWSRETAKSVTGEKLERKHQRRERQGGKNKRAGINTARASEKTRAATREHGRHGAVPRWGYWCGPWEGWPNRWERRRGDVDADVSAASSALRSIVRVSEVELAVTYLGLRVVILLAPNRALCSIWSGMSGLSENLGLLP